MIKIAKTALAIMIVLTSFAAAAVSAPVNAKLSGVAGQVFVQPAGGSFEPAANGASVSAGATLKTGPDGTAVILWGKGNSAKVGKLSIVKIDALTVDDKTGTSVSNLSLGQGRLISRTDKLATQESQFTVRTPAAIAGVRGTAFDCAINPANNQTTVAVVEGSISLSAGGVETIVEQGFESAVDLGGTPTPPTEIPPEKAEEIKSTVSELKTVAETSAAPATEEKKTETAAPVAAEAVSTADSTLDTVLDNAVDQSTIQNAIIDNASTLVCPSGGGCIYGTIEWGQ